MSSLMIIVAGMVLGGVSAGDFGDAVSSFKEEIERNGAWGKIGKRTVESVLDGFENSYNNFNGKTSPSAEEITFLVGQEYHMYSTIHKETSLRTDSPLVRFLLSDMDSRLYSVLMLDNKPECDTAVGKARTSLNGAYNYRDQAYCVGDVKKKCVSPKTAPTKPSYHPIF